MSRLELMSIGRRSKRRWKARYKWERGRPTARHGTIGSKDDQLIGTPADVVLSFLCVCVIKLKPDVMPTTFLHQQLSVCCLPSKCTAIGGRGSSVGRN